MSNRDGGCQSRIFKFTAQGGRRKQRIHLFNHLCYSTKSHGGQHGTRRTARDSVHRVIFCTYNILNDSFQVYSSVMHHSRAVVNKWRSGTSTIHFTPSCSHPFPHVSGHSTAQGSFIVADCEDLAYILRLQNFEPMVLGGRSENRSTDGGCAHYPLSSFEVIAL